MSSRSVWTPACQYLLVTKGQANEYRKEAMGLVMEECFERPALYLTQLRCLREIYHFYVLYCKPLMFL